MFDLNGKAAVDWRGEETGIGRAIALRLAAEGCDLAVMDMAANRSPCWTRPFETRLTNWSDGPEGRPYGMPLERRCAAMVQECLSALAKSILVNNAGSADHNCPSCCRKTRPDSPANTRDFYVPKWSPMQ
jgi:NAD(P)-dependent dehydrogenase (short-subunit alcohol dehydrogenase family)